MNDVKLNAIFSTARAGSTWLGSIVASHPRITYRFEPFSRLRTTRQDIGSVFEAMVSGNGDLPNTEDIYNVLLPSDPKVDKPPFFAKQHQTRAQRGKILLWYMSRKCSPLIPLYRWLYTPLDSPVVVFKEVAHTRLLEAFITHTSVPVTYLIRHPCGVVWSKVVGQTKGVMPTGRQAVLKKLLDKHDHALADRYAGTLDRMSVVEKEALLWRIDVEKALAAISYGLKGLVVIYEDLCERPVEAAKEVLDYFGLGLSDQTVTFVEQSTSAVDAGRWFQGQRGINTYFSIYRNPKASRDKWKHQMPSDDRRRVLDIVKDSPAFAYGASRGFWD